MNAFFCRIKGTKMKCPFTSGSRNPVLPRFHNLSTSSLPHSGNEEERGVEMMKEGDSHPYSFHVSGPRKVSVPTWREIICSSWKDVNYKRTVIACFIQAVYLLEIDRQEKRTEETSLAPKWWIPFKYKLVETLVDERDGSIYGAILEWDRSSSMANFILVRPSGAPKAVLALRGTLLKSPTIRRDVEDDLRFLAWESLEGSVRFHGSLQSLLSITEKYGSKSVCIAGHSLGAGFALQVGKALAKQGIFVEAHLFNPPSVSLSMSIKSLGEKAEFVWRKFRGMLPLNVNGEPQIRIEEDGLVSDEMRKWVPHLYVNNSDYICCYYTDTPGRGEDVGGGGEKKKDASLISAASDKLAAKLFVQSNGKKQRFLEAHGLEQWWSDDLELAPSHSKLITKQLKSLYTRGATLH